MRVGEGVIRIYVLPFCAGKMRGGILVWGLVGNETDVGGAGARCGDTTFLLLTTTHYPSLHWSWDLFSSRKSGHVNAMVIDIAGC